MNIFNLSPLTVADWCNFYMLHIDDEFRQRATQDHDGEPCGAISDLTELVEFLDNIGDATTRSKTETPELMNVVFTEYFRHIHQTHGLKPVSDPIQREVFHDSIQKIAIHLIEATIRHAMTSGLSVNLN